MPLTHQPRFFPAYFRHQPQSVISENTRKAYAYDWAMFATWCASSSRDPLPATDETVALYLKHILEAGKKVTTADRRLSAICYQHRLHELPSPTGTEVYHVLAGARRTRKEKPRRMRALSVDQLRQICSLLEKERTDITIRDQAVLVLGFSTALRRSSIAALELSDIEITDKGVLIDVVREKQDQEGRGRQIAVPLGEHSETCLKTCLQRWIAIRGEQPGPLFHALQAPWTGKQLDGEAVERIVKRAVKRLGLDPCDRWAAHSLRAGFITSAFERCVPDVMIAQHTGHRSLHVLRRYFRRTAQWENNVAGILHL